MAGAHPYRHFTPSLPRRGFPWRVASLLVVALGSAALWRLEVDARGWDGLTWITYFHRAIPVGVAAFVLWATAAADVPTRARRVALGVGLGLLAAPLYVLASILLQVVFGRFGIGLALGPGSTASRFGSAAVMLTLWAAPVLAVLALGALVRARTTWLRRAAAVALWVAAIPLAVGVLQVLAPRFADGIHTIKTGAVVPFLVVALGLPLLPRRLS